MFASRRGRALAVLAALALLAPMARAAEAPGESAAPDPETQEILDALRQDAAAQGAPTPAPAPALPSVGAGMAGSGLLPSPETNPAMAIIGDFALAWFSKDDPLQRGGHDPSETGFNLQQLELSFQGAVDPYFRFDSFVVLSLYGVEVEEAYGTTLGLPWNLQVRAGQFYTRFGRQNEVHPHAWTFADNSVVLAKFFGSEGQRGLGAELSWLAPLPWYVELHGTAMMARGDATMRSFFGSEDIGVDGLEDLFYLVGLEQFFPLSLDWSLSWGLSAAFGPNGTGRDNRTEIYGTDLYLRWKPATYGSYQLVTLQVEGLLRRRQVAGDVLQDWGGYAQVFWKFAQRWGVAARYDLVSGVAGDYLDPDEDDMEHRVSAAVTFWATEFSRIRLQYSADFPLWRDDGVTHAAFLALELVAGAHGSHKF